MLHTLSSYSIQHSVDHNLKKIQGGFRYLKTPLSFLRGISKTPLHPKQESLLVNNFRLISIQCQEHDGFYWV